jgi:hypothetical protein
MLTRHRKWTVDFCAPKFKTLPLFCFREHNCRTWRGATIYIVKCNIFNMQDIMWYLARARGPQVTHAWFSVMDSRALRRTVYQIAASPIKWQQAVPFLSSAVFMTVTADNQSRDSSVGIALGYGLHHRGCRVRFLTGAGNFSLRHRFQNGSAAHPASYPMVPEALSPGLKRPGVKLTTHLHLVPRSKNEWNYTCTPQYAFMAWCSVKA